MSLQRKYKGDIMTSSATRIHTLQLKEGSYTRVEYDLTETPRLYAVDQQNGPVEENEVEVWECNQQMVVVVKGGEQKFLLNVEKNTLMLEKIFDKPDISSLKETYWFCKKKEAASEQYRITSKPSPTQCLIIKEDEERLRLIDIDDIDTTTSTIAVFITP